MKKRIAWAFSAFILVSAVSGCANETQDGSTTVYTWAVWVPCLVLVGGLVGSAAGVFLLRWSKRLGIVLVVVGMASVVVIVPGLFIEKVAVSDSGFMVRTGFWFHPNSHDVSFADLARIEIKAEDRSTRHVRDIEHVLVCFDRSGGSVTVPVSDLMKRGAEERILEIARQHDIPVVEDRPR